MGRLITPQIRALRSGRKAEHSGGGGRRGGAGQSHRGGEEAETD